MGEDKDESDLTSLDDAKISAVFIGSALASDGDGACGETARAAGSRAVAVRSEAAMRRGQTAVTSGYGVDGRE